MAEPSGRTLGRSVLPEVTKRLPEDSRKTSSGNFPEEVVHPEEFRKTRSSGRTFKFPEDLSGRNTSSVSGFFVFFCVFFKFFFKQKLFCFFLNELFYLFWLFCFSVFI